MRLILDTNVVVSANIQRSYPFLLVDRIFADPSLLLCISEPLFREYVQVLGREKFAKFPDFAAKAQAMLADIQRVATIFSPTIKINIIEDEPDNRLLELAEESKADFLVTGNTADFTLSEYKGTRIISPKEMFEILNAY